MHTQTVFKRYELKYMLTYPQYQRLKQVMTSYMVLDSFGRHSIHNVYFDTDDFLLIRRSIEKPCYKEKLRVRSYGNEKQGGSVFVELKKKYQGIVYKRRLELPQDEAYDFLLQSTPLSAPTQISREISYFMELYQTLKPQIALHYEREAFYGLEYPDFRMTFDHQIRMNRYQEKGSTPILDGNIVLLEIKTGMGIPSWLLEFFTANSIYKTSFSKYGTAYQKFLCPQINGGTIHVA